MPFLIDVYRQATQYRSRKYPPLLLFRCHGDYLLGTSALLGGRRLESRALLRGSLYFAGTVLVEIDCSQRRYSTGPLIVRVEYFDKINSEMMAVLDSNRVKSRALVDVAPECEGTVVRRNRLKSGALFDWSLDCAGAVRVEIDLRKMALSDVNRQESRALFHWALDCAGIVL